MKRPATVLMIGLGGIGSPAAMALARSSRFVGEVRVCDDDVVDVLNLHRQIVFEPGDVGRPKVEALSRFERDGLRFVPRRERFTPETAAQLLDGVDVVLEGSDNFASKFLLADAARLAAIPAVIAAAVEWRGTVFLQQAQQDGACYRCVFEDLPRGPTPACADVGVMGPLVGLVGALAADAALRLLEGAAGGELLQLAPDGAVRRGHLPAQRGCALCGAAPRVQTLQRVRYERGLDAQERP